MFKLPKLAYKYDDLEPYIDEQTIHIHHDKHHQGYVNKLNAALEDQPLWQEKSLADILASVDQLPQEITQAVINNGGGHANHSLYWQIMSPNANQQLDNDVVTVIEDKWGMDVFKNEFTKTALGQFGSGWGWLVVNEQGELILRATANQNSPLMDGHTPILGVDVWEHAYYLKYQNKRADYLQNFWQVINWEKVDQLYRQTIE